MTAQKRQNRSVNLQRSWPIKAGFTYSPQSPQPSVAGIFYVYTKRDTTITAISPKLLYLNFDKCPNVS